MTASPTRILSGLLAFATGAGVGLVLTFTHRQYVLDVLGVPVPLGLIGALAIVAALLVGIRLAFDDRTAVLVAGAGVVAAATLLAFPIGAGSVLVLDDATGFGWAVGPAAVTLAAALWPERSPSGSDAGRRRRCRRRSISRPGKARLTGARSSVFVD